MSKVSGSFKTKTENVPPLSSLPSKAKRGYLWKLSGRSLLTKTNWKRKFFVLWEGRFYYYHSLESGEERGGGVLHLKYYNSCVEAPLKDHKKQTNVFELIASERGFLDQRHCYFSAETLGEMKDWVQHLKAAIDRIHRTMSNIPDIPEEKYCVKSASLSSLPSEKSEKQEVRENVNNNDRLNKSMDERPVCDVSMDRTYSYSSSEESLNQSFTMSLPLKTSGSIYTSMQRRSINTGGRRSSGQFHSLPKQNPDQFHSLPKQGQDQYNSLPKQGQDQYNSLPKQNKEPFNSLTRQNGEEKQQTPDRNSSFRDSPCQSNHSSRRQLKFQDDVLLSGSRLCSREGSFSNLSMSTLTTSPQSQGELGSGGSSAMETERKILYLSQQLEELKRLYRHLDSETTSNRQDVGSVHESLATMNTTARGIEERINRFQAYMTGIERQAGTLMLEIRATQDRVLRTLEEAERARRDYQNMKQKAEHLILQIQGDAVALNLPSQQLNQPSLFTFGSQDSSPSSAVPTPSSVPSISSSPFPSSSNQIYSSASSSPSFPHSQTFPGPLTYQKPRPNCFTPSRGEFQPSPLTRGRSGREGRASVQFCQDPKHSEESFYQKPPGPVYSTPLKSAKESP